MLVANGKIERVSRSKLPRRISIETMSRKRNFVERKNDGIHDKNENDETIHVYQIVPDVEDFAKR